MTLTHKLMDIIAEEQAAKWAEAESADKRWAVEAGEHAPKGPSNPAFDTLKSVNAVFPDTNPKTAFGMRKPSFHCIPPAALVYLGAVMQDGANKYGLMNWREHAVTFSVYYNAMMRHAFAILDGEWIDPESGQPHLAHIMACATVMLDAKENGKLNDDRPKVAGAAAKMVRPK